MALYKIADIVTEINPKYDFFADNAKPYLYCKSEAPQIKINLNYDFLANKLKTNPHMNIGTVEAYYLAYIFNKRIVSFDSMMIHSSAVLYKGKAYLFSAPSGAGKSSHTRLWIEKFGDGNVTIINDDQPVVRYIDGDFFAYGTPFDGGTGINRNIRVPLGAVIFIEQAENNSVARLEKSKVIPLLMQNTKRFRLDKVTGDLLLNTMDRLISSAPFYRLRCNTDISSAVLCENKLRKDGVIT